MTLEQAKIISLTSENAILQRKIEDMEHKRFERMDTDDAISGGRSLSEVCESEEKLKEALRITSKSLATYGSHPIIEQMNKKLLEP